MPRVRIEGPFCRYNANSKYLGFVSKLPAEQRLREFGYWRIPGIAEAAKTYDRILYLDSDIHVEGSNLEKLLSIDMKGAPIAAVRDVHQSVRPHREAHEFKKLGWNNAPYFNAGVMLIDGAKFLRENAIEMIENCAQKFPHALTTYDQSLLNIAYYKIGLNFLPSGIENFHIATFKYTHFST